MARLGWTLGLLMIVGSIASRFIKPEWDWRLHLLASGILLCWLAA